MRSVSDLAADFSTTPEPNVSCGCVETATAGRSAQRGSVLDRLLFGVRFILRSGEVSEQRISGESVPYVYQKPSLPNGHVVIYL